ncbi:unnamed protein product [Rotaria socialis]|uniref:Uncharacterized protein n=2 Tax=Rotaria socialis TaxID=392032 RepID=A0A817RHD9_9BILA|nr:unnamed protein product [Rotaria socialis]CAF3541203.1 unnamed protein product [Rotaria socialis]CAF4265799.1 unnamed protein product [Rotaria socialis]CAF4405863.1 unnamed protein product [Rotaria socialis]
MMELNNPKLYTVVWFGTPRLDIDEESKVNAEVIIENGLYVEDNDINSCLKKLQLMQDENILLVITCMASDKLILDENLLTQVHHLPQVKIIYVPAKYGNRHPSHVFPKLRQLSNQSVSLRIRADLRVYAQMTDSITFNTFSEKSSLAVNGDFMHFQMLIDCIIDDHFSMKLLDNYSTFDKSKKEFIETCKEIYKNERTTLIQIEEFANTYKPEKALYWYTQNSFVYKLLNGAMRTNNTRLILIFRFFIIDIYQELKKQCDEPIISENQDGVFPTYYVYRAQIMSKDELDRLRKSLGQIISMKSFLSTSLNRQFALFFLGEVDEGNQSSLVPTLIQVDLDRDDICLDYNRPFANITAHSCFGEAEEEVLFMSGSCFRVVEIRRSDKGIWYVSLAKLKLFDGPLDYHSNYGKLYHYMKDDFLHPLLNLQSDVGLLLFQSGNFDLAEVHFERLIQHLSELVYVPEQTENQEDLTTLSRTGNKSTDIVGFIKDLEDEFRAEDKVKYVESAKEDIITSCYYMLGRIKHEKGLFDESIVHYEEVLRRTEPCSITNEKPRNSIKHVLYALCYFGLGATYEINGNTKRAFESYTKALHMFEEAHDGIIDDSPFSPGSTYIYKGHCLIGLGNFFLIEQNYEQADEYYRKALSLFDTYLPVGHPDQSRARQKIAKITQTYRCKPIMALEDYKDCLENYLRALPSDHVDIARLYQDMAHSFEQLPNGLENTLEYAMKAANIFGQYLPKDHKDNREISQTIARIRSNLHLEK